MTTSNKSDSPRVQHESPLPAAPSSSNDNADSDIVIRFASNDKPLGRTISFVIKQLRESTRPVVLQGSGLAMTKVVTVAGIARDRVGEIHQICEFLNIASTREGGSDTTGIQITLSSKEADVQDMLSIGYCEPLKKGFMLANLPEAARKRIQNKRKPSSTKQIVNDKTDNVKNEKVVKAETSSPKQRETSAKPPKKRQYREKKPVTDDTKPVESEAKNDVNAGEKQKKRRQKYRNNKKAVVDENQPPANSAKADPKTPKAVEKKEASDEHQARNYRHQNDDNVFRGGSGVRRGAPHHFYNNYGQSRQYDYYERPHPGYYGSPNGYGSSPSGPNGYQRQPYVNNRGGNPRQQYPRYQMAYPAPQGIRGGRGSYGYSRGGAVIGDLSGNMAYQRSNASYRDEILEQSTIKREVGTRQNLQNH